MTTEQLAKSQYTPFVAPSRVMQTNKQVTASLLAKGLANKAQWKTLIEDARLTWPLITMAELATVEGNLHALAGLVQLRHRMSRADSDQQVKDFFAAQSAAYVATADNR